MTRILDSFDAQKQSAPRPPALATAWEATRKALKPVASLRLTVALFALCMVLVFFVTWEQMYQGIDAVVQKYIRAYGTVEWTRGGVTHRIPYPNFVWLPVPGTAGTVLFPGGWLLGLLLLLNLLAAHFTRFRFSWRQVGIWTIHAGIILLLVGELITGVYQVEGQMKILKNSSSNYVEVVRHAELAIVHSDLAGPDTTVVVPASLLQTGERIVSPELPFDIVVDEFMPNSELKSPGIGNRQPLTRAQFSAATVERLPEVTGTDPAQPLDVPSAMITLRKKATDESLGTYTVSVFTSHLHPSLHRVSLDGKNFDVALRFKRVYKPYTIHLTDFHHDKYMGTEVAKDFRSEIRLVDPSRGEDRKLAIWMNHPLRHAGETMYQSAVLEGDAGTVLQVVRNPGWLIPYFACTVVVVGLLMHFGVTLARFLKRTV